MRGYRISRASRKLDVVIVAVRYAGRGKKLALGQAYLRRGKVWGDLVLLERDDMIRLVGEGKQVVAGKPDTIPGEFIVYNRVQLAGDRGAPALAVNSPASGGDDLNLPLF